MDTPKTRLNVPMILASALAIIGLFTGYVLVGLGLVGMIYSWVTTPRQYLIFENALVIVFGRPRVKAIPFPEIDNVEMLTVPAGNVLGVRTVNGKRAIISVVNVDEFKVQLEGAIRKFNSTGGQPAIIEQGPDTRQTPNTEPSQDIEAPPVLQPPQDIDEGQGDAAPY